MLIDQIMALKGRETSDLINLNKETEASCSNQSENSSEINLDISRAPPIESPINPQVHQGLPFFNPGSIRVGEFEQLLTHQSTARSTSDHHQLHCTKTEPGVQEGNFSSLLCSVEEQPPFWPWAADHHHNFHWAYVVWARRRCLMAVFLFDPWFLKMVPDRASGTSRSRGCRWWNHHQINSN